MNALHSEITFCNMALKVLVTRMDLRSCKSVARDCSPYSVRQRSLLSNF